MATTVWWMDPPRNFEAGGYITHSKHDDEETIDTENQSYYCGFKCVRQWYLPFLSDHYESYSYHSFFKFQIPTTSGTVQSAYLTMMVGNAGNIMNVNPVYMDVDVYYKPYKDVMPPPASNPFPWDTLDEWDYSPAQWTYIDHWEDMYDMWADYMIYGPYWLPMLEVTSGLQVAIGNSCEWFGVRVSPNYDAPLDWDWDERPTAYDQECWIGFYGACTPAWSSTPTGHPYSHSHPTPWLKITYDTGEEQEVPGEPYTPPGGSYPASGVVNCVAADAKAKSAIAGTSAGGLWYVWSGGGEWDKIFEVDSEVTAVYIDYLRNLLDYPNEAIAWFGTSNGDVYRSVNSMASWQKVYEFSGAIGKIKGSNIDSSKVAVGAGTDIYVSGDGGDNWQLSYSG